MEPNISRNPLDWVAAMPSAKVALSPVEAEHAGGGRRGAENAGRAGDVPADVVMGRVDGVAEPAFHLDPDDQRLEEGAPGKAVPFGEGQQRRGDRPRRVDDRLEVGVVEIEDVARNAHGESGAEQVGLALAARHRELRRAGEGRERVEGDVDGRMAGAADRAAEPVHEGPHRLAAGSLRDPLVDRLDREGGQLAGDGRGAALEMGRHAGSFELETTGRTDG
jgi:hypothetical protein